MKRITCLFKGHDWGKFETVKYGNFGKSRNCKRCGLMHTTHPTEGDSYYRKSLKLIFLGWKIRRVLSKAS